MTNKNQNQIIYVCSDCGGEYLKWQGKCDSCGSWNTLKEIRSTKIAFRQSSRNIIETIEAKNLNDVKIQNFKRVPVGIFEVDRVLGGGIVPGSVILLAGEPGIGKSTLVMQIASKINTLYISGEESLHQIKMRADRLGLMTSNVSIIAETNVDNIINALSKIKDQPQLIIVDSIQTIYCQEYPSTAGSLLQVREAALRLSQFAKQKNIPIILIGHVTKEGSIAGPKTLEHMVDVVLNLEGERYHDMRILRASKNRFGQTSEIGIFEIENKGLREIKNPSKLFLSDVHQNIPGSAICATIEGTRPLLVEIQALTSATNFGYPKITASGFDVNRLQLIIAILTNRANINLSSTDIYINVSGGFYLKEPAADLAVALAITSSFKKRAVNKDTVIFGELALSGDIRKVSFEGRRTEESKRLGYTKLVKSKHIVDSIKEVLDV